MAVSKSELEAAHRRYGEALLFKSEKLVQLDRWYRVELSSTLKRRQSKEKGAFLTSAELVQVMKWKLTRGKFRPRLEQLAQSNADEYVQSQTRKAFDIVSSSDAIESAKESVKLLNTLKGVGPATSSAILAAFRPESFCFMSDEALLAAAGLAGKPKYSMGEWQWFQVKTRERAVSEGWQGGARELEEAAWSHTILKRQGVLASGVEEASIAGEESARPPTKRPKASNEQQPCPSKRSRTRGK